jgi:hypothetical protein
MAAAMGWSAADVADSSLWQLIAAHDGWRRANCSDDEGLTDSEFEALGDLVDPGGKKP